MPREYKSTSCPVLFDSSLPTLFRGYARSWPALEKWNFEYFRDYFGEILVIPNFEDRSNCTRVKLKYYLKNFNTRNQQLHWKFEKHTQLLSKDYFTPKEFESWFNKLPEELNPYFKWLIFSPRGFVTKLHSDILGTSTWNLLVVGEKRWKFSTSMFQVVEINSPESANVYKNEMLINNVGIVQKKSDIIYIPSNLLHEVDTKQDSISISENFVNSKNIELFLLKTETYNIKGWNNIFSKDNIKTYFEDQNVSNK